MKIRGLAVTLAFLLAVGATAAVFLYVKGVRDEAQRSPLADVVTVIVPKRDIPPGTRLDPLISAGQFTTVQVPREAVVKGAVTDLSQIQGRTTNSFIVEGEQLTVTRLRGSTTQVRGGPLGIPEGHQALTISLEGQRRVAGVIQPQDHVVVYATVEAGGDGEGGGGQRTTVVLVPDALVLRVGSGAEASGGGLRQQDDESGSFVTLALLPQDAERLVLAQEQGGVWLALLPPNEEGRPQPPVTLGDLVR